jgi:predicted restriction endonuclease
MVNDPFTDPENANNAFASPSTQTKTDTRRINSLENGMLLCTQHHGDYDHFRISIHPMVRMVFSPLLYHL